MKNRKTILLLPLLTTLLPLPGCNNDTTPGPPALGVQIDRMGRAGVNTALVDPFNLDAPSKGANQDAYNASAAPSQWAGSFAGRIATNLAILDSLDTVCGNQLLAGPAPAPGRYGTLATVQIGRAHV